MGIRGQDKKKPMSFFTFVKDDSDLYFQIYSAATHWSQISFRAFKGCKNESMFKRSWSYMTKMAAMLIYGKTP